MGLEICITKLFRVFSSSKMQIRATKFYVKYFLFISKPQVRPDQTIFWTLSCYPCSESDQSLQWNCSVETEAIHSVWLELDVLLVK